MTRDLSEEGNLISLAALKVGECARVREFLFRNDFRRKLLGLGVYPGAKVRVIGKGSFGNPIEISLNGDLRIAIRKRDALGILVESCDGEDKGSIRGKSQYGKEHSN